MKKVNGRKFVFGTKCTFTIKVISILLTLKNAQ